MCDQVHSSLVDIFYFILLYFIFLHKYAGMETKGVVKVILVSHTQITAMSFGSISGIIAKV